jgi:hypothetical protein
MMRPNSTKRDFHWAQVPSAAPAVKKFHLILVLHRRILFNSASNCEMDMAAACAKEGKTAARQAGQQNFWTR